MEISNEMLLASVHAVFFVTNEPDGFHVKVTSDVLCESFPTMEKAIGFTLHKALQANLSNLKMTVTPVTLDSQG